MLSLLLDENLSPHVARQITEKRPEIAITSVHYWHEGHFRATRDEAILLAAAREGLTLVTHDQTTIYPLLVQWIQTQTDHAGVVFVDDRTIASNNIGSLVRSLVVLWDACHQDSWTNRVDFLRR